MAPIGDEDGGQRERGGVNEPPQPILLSGLVSSLPAVPHFLSECDQDCFPKLTL